MPNKYSSDTSDKEWDLIEKIINTRKGKQGRPRMCKRPREAQGAAQKMGIVSTTRTHDTAARKASMQQSHKTRRIK